MRSQHAGGMCSTSRAAGVDGPDGVRGQVLMSFVVRAHM
jgi:hypothetical protein